jgi:hypothetical protein
MEASHSNVKVILTMDGSKLVNMTKEGYNHIKTLFPIFDCPHYPITILNHRPGHEYIKGITYKLNERGVQKSWKWKAETHLKPH